MAKLFQTGFEGGVDNLTPVLTAGASGGIESAAPLSGDYSYQITGSGTYPYSAYVALWSGVAPATDTGFGFAANAKISDLNGNSRFGMHFGGLYNAMTLHFMGDGSVMVRSPRLSGDTSASSGVGDLIAQSATGLVVADTEFHISAIGEVHATTGWIKVAINGATVIDFTGNTWYTSAYEPGRALYLHEQQAASKTTVDDLIVFDDTGADWNDLPVPMKCEALRLDGQVSAQFVGSDADSVDNHLLIDEHPVSAADYVESGTVTDADFYTLANRVETGAVTTLAVIGYAENSEGGAASLKLVADSGATVSKSSALGLGASMNQVSYVLDTDPDTAVAWTDGGVNALEVGIEVA